MHPNDLLWVFAANFKTDLLLKLKDIDRFMRIIQLCLTWRCFRYCATASGLTRTKIITTFDLNLTVSPSVIGCRQQLPLLSV